MFDIHARSRAAYAKMHGLSAFLMQLRVAANKHAVTPEYPTPSTELPDHGRDFYFPAPDIVFTIKNAPRSTSPLFTTYTNPLRPTWRRDAWYLE